MNNNMTVNEDTIYVCPDGESEAEHMVEEIVSDSPEEYVLESQDEESEYFLEEEEALDSSAYNYSQASGLTEQSSEEDEISLVPKKNVWALLLLVLSNPIQGWKKVRRERITVEQAQSSCFYPLLALMAVSHFAAKFYSSRVDLSEIIMGALTSFVGYFAGYFFIVILLKTLLPKGAGKCMETDFGKVFVVLNLSSLCIFFTAMELLPMLWPILIFLPLWTIYVICRGVRFFRFPEDKSITCTGLMCLLIVGIPAILEWCLNEVLPM